MDCHVYQLLLLLKSILQVFPSPWNLPTLTACRVLSLSRQKYLRLEQLPAHQSSKESILEEKMPFNYVFPHLFRSQQWGVKKAFIGPYQGLNLLNCLIQLSKCLESVHMYFRSQLNCELLSVWLFRCVSINVYWINEWIQWLHILLMVPALIRG